MSDITRAIAARQAQVTQLQSDIETLQRAAGIMSGQPKTAAKATRASSPTTTRKQPKRRAVAKGSAARPKTKQKRSAWSSADREAISKRMKAYWAKRRKAKR